MTSSKEIHIECGSKRFADKVNDLTVREITAERWAQCGVGTRKFQVVCDKTYVGYITTSSSPGTFYWNNYNPVDGYDPDSLEASFKPSTPYQLSFLASLNDMLDGWLFGPVLKSFEEEMSLLGFQQG